MEKGRRQHQGEVINFHSANGQSELNHTRDAENLDLFIDLVNCWTTIDDQKDTIGRQEHEIRHLEQKVHDVREQAQRDADKKIEQIISNNSRRAKKMAAATLAIGLATGLIGGKIYTHYEETHPDYVETMRVIQSGDTISEIAESIRMNYASEIKNDECSIPSIGHISSKLIDVNGFSEYDLSNLHPGDQITSYELKAPANCLFEQSEGSK